MGPCVRRDDVEILLRAPRISSIVFDFQTASLQTQLRDLAAQAPEDLLKVPAL
jgi:hypothetical protein